MFELRKTQTLTVYSLAEVVSNMKYHEISICSNGYIMAMSSFFEPLSTYDHSLCRGPRMMTPPGHHFRVVPPGFLLSVRGGEAKGTGCGGFPMDHHRLAT